METHLERNQLMKIAGQLWQTWAQHIIWTCSGTLKNVTIEKLEGKRDKEMPRQKMVDHLISWLSETDVLEMSSESQNMRL